MPVDRFTESLAAFESFDATLIDELPLWSAPFGLKLLDMVRLRPGITAVDIGPGTGFPAVELAQRLGATSHVHAVDPWPAGLARIQARLIACKVENVTLHTGRAESLPLPDGSVDLIVSNNGLNNVEDFEAALGECARIARLGAQLVYAYNLPGTMLELYEVLDSVLEQRGLARERAALAAHIEAKRKPLALVTDLLERASFRVEHVVEDAFSLRFLDGTTMFAHSRTRLAFLPSWLAVVDPAARGPVFAETERRLDERARAAGDLTLTIPFACLDCRRR